MTTVKILKRKDASSVIIAIAVGLALIQFAATVTTELAARISNIGQDSASQLGTYDWRINLLQPAVQFLLQLVVIELVVLISTALRGGVKTGKK